MLATTFYRMAGSPSLEDKNLGYPFSDVPGDGWYADGVYWARMEGVVGGYGNNAFGPDDPVTREQAVTILWRYAGSPTASSGTFSDSDDLADWAVSAAGWAQAMGLLIGWADSSFLPQTPLTRAEAAVLLARYLEGGEATADGSSSILVAYFSATGTTRPLAEYAADMLISSRTEKKKEETDRWKRELKKVDKRMAELSKILNKLYEDLALEKISEERYQAMAPDYEREQILLREKREQLTAEIAQNEEIYENVEKFLSVIWK